MREQKLPFNKTKGLQGKCNVFVGEFFLTNKIKSLEQCLPSNEHSKKNFH